jgi:hypothetical protein
VITERGEISTSRKLANESIKTKEIQLLLVELLEVAEEVTLEERTQAREMKYLHC